MDNVLGFRIKYKMTKFAYFSLFLTVISEGRRVCLQGQQGRQGCIQRMEIDVTLHSGLIWKCFWISVKILTIIDIFSSSVTSDVTL